MYDTDRERAIEAVDAAILALTPVEEVGLERFADDVADVHSRIVIVHQLRASAAIQDRQTKKETGWADTNDRATMMRKAADTIERLALSTPVAAQGDAPNVNQPAISAYTNTVAEGAATTTPAHGDEVREALGDGVSTLAAVRATTISDDEWNASRLHFRDLCAQTIERMNTALRNTRSAP